VLITIGVAGIVTGVSGLWLGTGTGSTGCMFGLIALSNQSGVVVGSMIGAVMVGGAGYGGFAAAGQGLLAAALAPPLLRPRHLG
jgi:hypothetical protein